MTTPGSTFSFEPPTLMDNLKMAARQLRKLRFRLIPEGLILAMIMLFGSSFIIESVSPWDAERGRPQDRLSAPTYELKFWDGNFMGTDQQGRDVFVRVIKGARFSFYVAIIALGIGGSVGLVVGIVSGYFGGKIDNLLMRTTDIVLAIPVIFAALLLAALYTPSLKLVAIALGINLWALYARMIRGETLSLVQRDFIKLSRIAGAGGVRIMTFHIFPHVTSTWLVLLSLQVGSAILAESSLSFLGAGIPPPTPALGAMAAKGRQYIETAWWVSVYPGVAILVIVLCFNLVGDWLRDRLDPRFQ
jgi:peptide/nickel transport system permease protein